MRMKVKDFVKQNKDVLLAIVRNGINPNWAMYAEMVDDYERLKAEGHQPKTIVYYLSDVYFTSVRNIYRVLTKFGTDLL